jgi:predicted nucleic acid-binding protein
LAGRIVRVSKKNTIYIPKDIAKSIGISAKSTSSPPTTRAGAFKHRENFKKISISSEVLLEALELRKRGFKDIIDLVLYIAARENNLKFLTLDRGMASFLKKRALQGTNQTAKRMSF